jgi:predicted secreted protein
MALSDGQKLAVGVGLVGAVGLTTWALWPKKAAAALGGVKCPPGTVDVSGSGQGPCEVVGGAGAPTQKVAVGPAQDGSTLNLHPGDTLVVGLPEDPSTGGVWAFAVLTDGVLQQSGEGTATSPGTSVVTHYLTLQVMQTGTTKLQANLVDPSGNIVKTWTVTVNVSAPKQTGGLPPPAGGIAQISPTASVAFSLFGSQKHGAVHL